MSASDHLSKTQFQGVRGLARFVRLSPTNIPATAGPGYATTQAPRFTAYTSTAPSPEEF